MRFETLPLGTGPPIDAFSAALFAHASPASGLLESFAALGPDARGTGTTPPRLAETLAAEQERHGLGARAASNALSLSKGALAVVTGQQAGLLGGPMLSLHKAAGAIALARSLETRLGRPVVPVFWIASEDHDWAEANRATVLDASGAAVELSLDVAGDHRSVRDVPIPPQAVDGLLARLAAALPATERAATAVALARPPAGTDLGAWFAMLLGRFLGDAGLVVVEPHVLAPWAGATYAALVRDAEPIAKAIRAAGTALSTRGLEAPLSPAEDGLPVFLRDGPRGPRRRSTLDRAEIARLVEQRPEIASGDVIGRIFVQNALLPVVACAGGPTELAYWAQVRAAHVATSRHFPAAAPRPSATWVEPRVAEAVRAFGASLAEVIAGRERAPDTPPSSEASTREVEAARAAIEALAQESSAMPTAARHVEAMRKALADLEAAARGAREEKDGRGRARWKRATDAIRPRGSLQERVLGPLSIVARHGTDALRAGLAGLDPLAAGHQVVHLD